MNDKQVISKDDARKWFFKVQKVSSELEEICEGNPLLMMHTCSAILHDVAFSLDASKEDVIEIIDKTFERKKEARERKGKS